MLRILFITVCSLTLVGCGSKSTDAPSAEAGGTLLSIKNPTAPETKELAETITSPVVQQLTAKAKAAAKSGQNAVAVEALSQAIGMDPQNSQLFHMRADVYSIIGEYANARADFSLAIQADPTNAALYNARGYFLMKRGVADAAVADFNKAIEVDPQYAAAVNNRGLIKLAKKEYDEALIDFAKAVELDNNYADAMNNRGFTQMKLGNLDKALSDLTATTKLKPDYTTAWNNTGLVYLQQENYAAAVEAFSAAIRLSPYDIRWLNHRYTAYQKLGKFEEANADASRANWLTKLNKLTQQAVRHSNNVDAWIARAAHLTEGNEYKAAVENYTQALKLAPANTVALNGRAQAWLQAGELKNAIADCDISLVTEPSQTAFSIRGDAWLALNNFDQAILDLEAGQRFDQSIAVAYRKRAARHKADGKTDLANDDLQKANNIDAALAGKLTDDSAAAEPIPFPEQ